MKMNSAMPDSSYRHYHEHYISNNNGTTAIEVFLAVTVVPLLALLQTLLFSLFRLGDHYELSKSTFICEFFIIVLPSIVSLTILSGYLLSVLSIILGVCLMILFLLHVSQKVNHVPLAEICKSHFSAKRRPCVTIIRSITNIVTAICILAVDFKIFPQRFSKTETMGFSIMDTGVGIYVALNGLTAPEARGIMNQASIFTTLEGSIPLWILGAIRLCATQILNYQQHVSEYGVHWNFFFTLACTKVIASLLMSLLQSVKFGSCLSISFFIITSYEMVLTYGLKDWLLGNSDRVDFVTANREGIFSLFGYVAIYFNGVCLGHLFFHVRPVTLQQNLLLVLSLIGVSFFLWSATLVCNVTIGVSRRMADMGYYIWIVTFTISTLCLSLLEEIASHFLCVSYKGGQVVKMFIPLLFQAINCHGLFFFLIANVLTGLINLSVKTLYVPPLQSFVILVVYMVICCGATCLFHSRRKCQCVYFCHIPFNRKN